MEKSYRGRNDGFPPPPRGKSRRNHAHTQVHNLICEDDLQKIK